ncbi:hypothetical protein MUK42_36722 [Musa troglodytarum]|uniref:Uncharacterized protein n=1 Tax=Musa troglodytarum TaxID=320322 RepID=A0A9E7FQU2_9LILI|nr:hypothetical protein MUK42_36722 [Musa troglodytarum]
MRDPMVGWDDDFLVVAAEGLRTGGGPALVGAQPMPKALRQPHKCSVDCFHHRCLLLGHNLTSGRGDLSGITR